MKTYSAIAVLAAQGHTAQPPAVNSPGAMVNFKKFRKVSQQQHGMSVLGYSSKGYAESHIDSEAFLR